MAETTYREWICQSCRHVCRVEPAGAVEPGCRCTTPVPKLRPTTVTQMHAPPPGAGLRALSDDEATLHALIRSRRRLRITFEADIAQAWTSDGPGGREVHLIVTTPDGRRHPVDPSMPGVRIEPAEEA